MSHPHPLPVLRIAPNVPVFDLPILVALEHGLFERRGLVVEFAGKHDPVTSSRDAFQRQKESLYESCQADAYNLCEWAGLDRSDRSARGSQVHALRPAVAAQVILSFDPAIQEPRDLAGVAVGINEFTGSHYTALQFLDGTLPREDVVVKHVGEPLVRSEALKSGALRAASLMEPYVSLALKEGAHIIAANFYRGAEVISPKLTPSQREAYLAAVNEAADLINADFDRYKHYLVEPVKDRIRPEEVGNHFVHYAHSKPLDEKRFAYTVEWMKSWGLQPRESDFEKLVAA
jgi:NitT/TauT family transport system substrate-binding protein